MTSCAPAYILLIYKMMPIQQRLIKGGDAANTYQQKFNALPINPQQIGHQPSSNQSGEASQLIKKILCLLNPQLSTPQDKQQQNKILKSLKQEQGFETLPQPLEKNQQYKLYPEKIHQLKRMITAKQVQIQHKLIAELISKPNFLKYLYANLSIQCRIFRQSWSEENKEILKGGQEQSLYLRNLIWQTLQAMNIALSKQLKAIFYIYNIICKEKFELPTSSEQESQNLWGVIDQLTRKQYYINYVHILIEYFQNNRYKFDVELTESQKIFCRSYLSFLDHKNIQQKVWIILILFALTIQNPSKEHKYMIRKWNHAYILKDTFGWNQLIMIERKQIITAIFQYSKKSRAIFQYSKESSMPPEFKSFLSWLIFYPSPRESSQLLKQGDYLKILAQSVPADIMKTTIVYYKIQQFIVKFNQQKKQITRQRLPQLPQEIKATDQYQNAHYFFQSYKSIWRQASSQIQNNIIYHSKQSLRSSIQDITTKLQSKLNINPTNLTTQLQSIAMQIPLDTNFKRTLLRQFDYILLRSFAQNCFLEKGVEIFRRSQIIEAIIKKNLTQVRDIILESLLSPDFQPFRLYSIPPRRKS